MFLMRLLLLSCGEEGLRATAAFGSDSDDGSELGGLGAMGVCAFFRLSLLIPLRNQLELLLLPEMPLLLLLLLPLLLLLLLLRPFFMVELLVLVFPLLVVLL